MISFGPRLRLIFCLALVFASATTATAAPSKLPIPIVRVGLLPSPLAQFDRQIVSNACQIRNLDPQFRSFDSFNEARSAWLQGDLDVIAGIAFEQALLLGGRFLPPYRTVKLQAVVATDSPIQQLGDLRSATVLVLPSGLGEVHANIRGWKPVAAATVTEALKVLNEGKPAALLAGPETLQLHSGYRQIDLDFTSPVSLALPANSPHTASLEAGLDALLRTGFAKRQENPSNQAESQRGTWIDIRILSISLGVLAAAILALAQKHAQTPTLLAQPGRFVLGSRPLPR
jgi:hypothetical protein